MGRLLVYGCGRDSSTMAGVVQLDVHVKKKLCGSIEIKSRTLLMRPPCHEDEFLSSRDLLKHLSHTARHAFFGVDKLTSILYFACGFHEDGNYFFGS